MAQNAVGKLFHLQLPLMHAFEIDDLDMVRFVRDVNPRVDDLPTTISIHLSKAEGSNNSAAFPKHFIALLVRSLAEQETGIEICLCVIRKFEQRSDSLIHATFPKLHRGKNGNRFCSGDEPRGVKAVASFVLEDASAQLLVEPDILASRSGGRVDGGVSENPPNPAFIN